KAQGATRVVAYCTHPVLSGAAIDNVSRASLDELVVTDTIPLSSAAEACGKIRQLSVAELLAETIRRIAFGESVSSLYVDWHTRPAWSRAGHTTAARRPTQAK